MVITTLAVAGAIALAGLTTARAAIARTRAHPEIRAIKVLLVRARRRISAAAPAESVEPHTSRC